MRFIFAALSLCALALGQKPNIQAVPLANRMKVPIQEDHSILKVALYFF